MSQGKVMQQIIAIGGRLDPTLKAAVDRANKMANGMGAKIKKAGAVAAGGAKIAAGAMVAAGAAGGAAMLKLSKSALDSYASYEQLVGGVETLFGKSAKTVIRDASAAYETAGMDANTYMETVTSFSASLLQGLDGDTKAAAKKANQAVVDMSDNANKMGTDIGRIQDAYQGFAKQNYTMLDNLKLGYGGTQAEMARLINDSGVLGKSMKVDAKSVNDVSFDKIVEAIHKVQTDMGITGTTAKEAASTIEGSVNSAKAAWTNWLTSLGDENADLDATTNTLVKTVSTAAKNIIPRLGTIVGSLVKSAKEYLPGALQSLGETLGPLARDILTDVFGDAGGSLYDGLGGLFDTLKDVFGGGLGEIAEGLPGALQSVGAAIPGVFDAIGSAAKTFLPMAMTTFGQVRGLVSGLAPVFAQLFSAVVPVLQSVAATVMPALTSAVQAVVPPIMEIANAALPPLMGLVQQAAPIVQQLAGVFASLVAAVVPIVEPLKNLVITLIPPIAGLISGVLAAISPLVGALQPVVDVIGNIVSGLGSLIDLAGQAISALADIGGQALGGLGSILGFATGGFTNGLAIAGEDPRYPTEAVISFNPAYRAQNLKYWSMAGAMLGARSAVPDVRGFATGGFTGEVGASLFNVEYSIGGKSTPSGSYDLSGMTFAPEINIRGNADADDIVAALRALEPEFVDFVVDALAKREEASYA